MEIRWRFHGFSTIGHPRAQRPPARAWSLQDGPGSIRDTSGSRWTTPGNRKTLRGSLRALPGSLRTLSGGPGTPWKQRQTIENDSKITKIIKIIEITKICQILQNLQHLKNLRKVLGIVGGAGGGGGIWYGFFLCPPPQPVFVFHATFVFRVSFMGDFLAWATH